MKNVGETQIMGGTGEKPVSPGLIKKDFKQMFLEVIAKSQNPQERLMASQMLKNVGFEIGPDDKEKAEVVIGQIEEEQEKHKTEIAGRLASMQQQEAALQDLSVEELRKKISNAPAAEKTKRPVMFMPAVKPKSGQNPITPFQ
ncbi:hypothetical protein IT407_03075 [Candidatus Uhrbacteria bacterium]|nr:hypothetical protein [Candidatus Uhrbacteria bacterium]